MNKAIILTNVQLTQEQIYKLQNTQILKVALNHHAQNLIPTIRWTSDYIATKLKNLEKCYLKMVVNALCII